MSRHLSLMRLAAFAPPLSALLLAVPCLGVWSAARASASPDPAATFQAIHADYLHGNLEAAAVRAEQARRDYAAGGLPGDADWTLKFLLLEAEILLSQKRPDTVIALLTGGGVSFPKAGDLAVERSLLRGRAYYYLGRRRQSDRALREARRLAESSHSPLIGAVLRAEGVVQLDANRFDDAGRKFRASLAVAREQGDALLEATDLVDIGYLSLQIGQYDRAVALSQQAADFANAIQAHTQAQWALGNVGVAYVNLGEFELALTNFQEADRQAEKIGMTASRVLWLQDAGFAAFKLGQWDLAQGYDAQALGLARALPAADTADQVANIEANLALLLYGQGQFAAARTHSDAAMTAARRSKDSTVVAYAMFLQGLLATRRDTGTSALHVLLRARRLAADADLRMNIENALANYHAGRHEPRSALHWYRRSIQTFEDRRSSIEEEERRLSLFATGDSIYRDYAAFLIGSGNPNDALNILDRSRAKTLQEGLGFADAESSGTASARLHGGVAEARKLARQLDAPILFYALGPDVSYLWAIDAAEIRLFTLPNQKDIQSLVERYQRSIQKSGDPLQTGDSAGISLYEVLIGPAAAMIPGGSKVFVIPDGILHTLNFETLVMPGATGPRYWIEDVTVTNTSSIRMLFHLASRPAAPTASDLLLIGDPVANAAQFQPLAHASDEIERIRRHFPVQGQTVLTQAAAVPAAYTASGPERFKYIHFVAHGTSNRSSPLDSAVVLSPPPRSPDDFKLYARDIVRHPLHATLVTVSACYGSGVRAYAGEGLVGLAWAFLRAGAHQVISALWQVDDDSTSRLMDRLYGELESGKTPDVALRAAKLSLIHSAGVYRKPFYWAAFQVYAGS